MSDNEFIEELKNVVDKLENFFEISKTLQIDKKRLTIINDNILIIKEIIDLSKSVDFKKNYLNDFRNILQNLSKNHNLKYIIKLDQIIDIDENTRLSLKNRQENAINQLESIFNHLSFNFNFFKKINFFNNNIVVIGANGSGKTSLTNEFKKYLKTNGVVISAQRILLVPTFDSITNHKKTSEDLIRYQAFDKSNKDDRTFSQLQSEFSILLKNLIAEDNLISSKYRLKAINSYKLGEKIENPEFTNLDIAIEIWNKLLTHRQIEFKDGINLNAKCGGASYPLMQMSDGEKVMLYLITQVLQAPKNGFIVIDEPEMYLHKTILYKLWNILETKREDCMFIYLTHDLDFATSRIEAKKIWIKSFIYPNSWEIEEIPTEEIPENLLLEILGSRNNILFCEGIKGSYDERIYSILFPHLTVIPVDGCFQVISHTKAFNKLKNVNTSAIGIIDSDHHTKERIESLKKHNIFSLEVAEIENLFLDKDFLKLICESISYKDDTCIKQIENGILSELDKHKIVQVSNYISSKINYFFTDSDVSKGNDLQEVNKNYKDFLDNVSIKEWYDERINYIEKIIEEKNYSAIIKIYNNKGLKKIANNKLEITNFTNRSLNLLKENKEAQKILLNYFPDELKTIAQILPNKEQNP